MEKTSFELRCDGHKQKDRDEAEGNKTKENGNYFPQPRLCPFVCDHQSVIRNWPIATFYIRICSLFFKVRPSEKGKALGTRLRSSRYLLIHISFHSPSKKELIFISVAVHKSSL